MRFHRLITPVLMLLAGCSPGKQEVDMILYNGTVYTVDDDFTTTEAIAIRDHRIVETGTVENIMRNYRSPQNTDLEGACVYPGWIDAHCHFFGYGIGLASADLVGTVSVEEIIARLKEHQAQYGGTWITGRGWDQNDWEVKTFPLKSMLDEYFPDVPVLLQRIDGHAAWVNSRALELAGITGDSRVEGGSVILDDGEPTGVLVDNAIGMVSRLVPGSTREEMVRALQQAEKNCFAVGLTSVHDAGLGYSQVEVLDSLYRSGSLKIRINAMLSPSGENFEGFVEKGPQRTDHLTLNTIKLFADGALGSRGARMIEPYTDDPGNLGLFVNGLEELEEYSRKAYEQGYIVATHAIGDAANREVLRIYAGILKGSNDRRWRIEHAQVIHPEDFRLFGAYNIIPSIQPVHATSDMYWAEERVGPDRIRGAYACRSLLVQNGWFPAGSDFPVEDINPLYGFYAAVTRKDQAGRPENGFRPEESVSREEALRAMTIWAARSAFEEDLKGSIEPGKLADLVVTEKDLMTAPDTELFRIRVTATYSGGEMVYERTGDHQIAIR